MRAANHAPLDVVAVGRMRRRDRPFLYPARTCRAPSSRAHPWAGHREPGRAENERIRTETLRLGIGGSTGIGDRVRLGLRALDRDARLHSTDHVQQQLGDILCASVIAAAFAGHW